MRHNCLRFPDKYISVRDVEDAVPYKLWKEHYKFVECGKVQVRRGRVTTPYSLPSHEYLPKTKSPVQAKKLVPDFYLILLVLYD